MKERFVNVYCRADGTQWCSFPHRSREEADKYRERRKKDVFLYLVSIKCKSWFMPI